ncbi:MAG TPA: sterol desaturase family protein [Burkholderiaceae bacterium]|jgi:sterol desaturase/sphingolipid hydroxylase (fatty acid hydroxylase superfamily)|nr:sterol desaturase family protein [Burkholderiaceae bacterium]
MSEQDNRDMFRSTMQNTFLLLGIAVAIGLAAVATFGFSPGLVRGAVAAAFLAPVIEYFIHRFISHGSWMYRFKPTSSIWKRIHYDHHQNPANPAVLLAAPGQVIGGSLMFSIPIGLIVGGYQGAAAAAAVGLFHAGVVELVHANSHAPIFPDWRYFRYLKALHLMHHFRNETVNFGVTSPLFDMLFRTHHAIDRPLARSLSVRNLGYGPEQARRFPWLSQLNRKRNPFGENAGFVARNAGEHEGGRP